ncbi:adapter protein MecA 1/2 [Scopulibacillus darangshiensis]|uniref:Adapter protein MecA n=1 Tax=Scopulibacillus darangshiensis TaxID=442528 RepID=A0A4R2P9F0_9BACL|nr:genetic competence negative regulator [Scopulibacillus darangshiensis]TCP31670.1 adapter protein MecA 1/2 [Scopulibacillus darangshiensis]
MRLERLTGDKIKIFLTFDDLNERGISKEDMWHDLPKVQQLFRDMIMEADDELGFQAEGPIDVEVFSLPAQGMVVIVSKSLDHEMFDDDHDEFIEMQVTLDESCEILYKFDDFEDVVSLSHKLYDLGVTEGALHLFEGKYYLSFEEEEYFIDLDLLIAVLAEYGNTSTMTSHRLFEYGKEIISDHAIRQLYTYFVERKTSQ